MKKIPITKRIADLGYASRRKAEELVRKGRVRINGTVAELGANVAESDTVEVDMPNQSTKIEYLAYYKPAGMVTVNAADGDKEIVTSLDLSPGIVPIGRLDKDSQGLIILTNDGVFAKTLLSEAVEKEYAVTVNKAITHDFLVRMRNGVKIKIPGPRGKSKWYTTQKTKIRRTSKNTFDIVLTEGKNRQIRRMCAALGYTVKDLRRFRIGDIELGELKPNQYRKFQPR